MAFHSYVGPRGKDKLILNLTGLVLILLPAFSGRENWITQDCERVFPKLRPEVMGQQSLDAVDLENEVSPRGSSWLCSCH